MRLPALVPLTLLIMLAGCSSPSASDEPVAAVEGDKVTAAVMPLVVKDPDPVPVTVTCTMTRTNVGTTTGYGLNIDRVATGLDMCMLEELFDGNTTWAQAALIEATWTRQPTQTGTDLWLESDACPPSVPQTCMPPHTMGSGSPLNLALTAADLRTGEGMNPSVMASGQGVVNDLEYTFYITLFPTDAIPSGFTAVA